MSILSFDQIANLAILRQFYYLAWRLFGVNIALLSPDMKKTMSIRAHESWSPFCVKLRQMGGEDLCQSCDWKYVDIVGNQRHSLRYRCWAGLREFMAPIILDGEILAYIQCGQVLDTQPTQADWAATHQALMDAGLENVPDEGLFYTVRVISPQTQEDLMALLELFGNYIAYAQYQLLLAEASQQSRIEELALSFIRNHYAEPISLDDVAKAACTSKRNLTRNFQVKSGLSVLGTIQELRIARACSLLQTGELTCMHVALECGFGSVQQFNRVFRKLRQCTPQAWQRRSREAVSQTNVDMPIRQSQSPVPEVR